MADIREQLTKYLTDAHSIEEQALAQLRTAPKIAGAPELSDAYREHLVETELSRTTALGSTEVRRRDRFGSRYDHPLHSSA